MKQDFFNLRRFARYFWQDIKNALSRYWITLVVLSVLSLICFLAARYGLLLFDKSSHCLSLNFRKWLFIGSLVVFAISMPVVCFGGLTNKKEGSQFLSFPASVFEKTLSMILTCVVVMPTLFFAGVFGSDEIVCAIYGWEYKSGKRNVEMSSISSLVIHKYHMYDFDSSWIISLDDTLTCRTYDGDTLKAFITDCDTLEYYQNDSLISKFSIANDKLAHISKAELMDKWDKQLCYIDRENSYKTSWYDIDLLQWRDIRIIAVELRNCTSYSIEKVMPERVIKSEWFCLPFAMILLSLFGALVFKKVKITKNFLVQLAILVTTMIAWVDWTNKQYSDAELNNCYLQNCKLLYLWRQFELHLNYVLIPLCLILCYLIYRRVKKLTF